MRRRNPVFRIQRRRSVLTNIHIRKGGSSASVEAAGNPCGPAATWRLVATRQLRGDTRYQPRCSRGCRQTDEAPIDASRKGHRTVPSRSGESVGGRAWLDAQLTTAIRAGRRTSVSGQSVAWPGSRVGPGSRLPGTTSHVQPLPLAKNARGPGHAQWSLSWLGITPGIRALAHVTATSPRPGVALMRSSVPDRPSTGRRRRVGARRR